MGAICRLIVTSADTTVSTEVPPIVAEHYHAGAGVTVVYDAVGLATTPDV